MERIFGIVLCLLVIVNAESFGRNNSFAGNEINEVQQTSDTVKAKENQYTELRKESLSVTPEQLQLILDDNKIIVYGIVMDWDKINEVISVVAFKTGDASIYTSSGQVYLGGFSNERVRNRALEFIQQGQEYQIMTTPINQTPLPDPGCVRFYFLTNKGKFYIQDAALALENGKSNLSRLFELGNNVLVEFDAIMKMQDK